MLIQHFFLELLQESNDEASLDISSRDTHIYIYTYKYTHTHTYTKLCITSSLENADFQTYHFQVQDGQNNVSNVILKQLKV
jgi:hypothetical protein